MDWTSLGQAAAGIGAAVVGARRWLSAGATSDSRRHALNRDLDLYERLPDDSEARADLAAHIDRQVALLVAEAEVTKGWNPLGVVLALLFLAGAGAIVYRIVALDWSGWWWFAATSLAVIGAAGLSQDLVPRERDERGRPLRAPRSTSTKPTSVKSNR